MGDKAAGGRLGRHRRAAAGAHELSYKKLARLLLGAGRRLAAQDQVCNTHIPSAGGGLMAPQLDPLRPQCGPTTGAAAATSRPAASGHIYTYRHAQVGHLDIADAATSNTSDHRLQRPAARLGADRSRRQFVPALTTNVIRRRQAAGAGCLLALALLSAVCQAYQLTNNLIANNLPPKFIQSPAGAAASGVNSEIVVRVKEGPQSIGKLIYTLKAEDPDEDPLTFGVLGTMASELLRIENTPGNQANVYLRKELDRETTESHQLVITLTDGKLGKGNWVSSGAPLRQIAVPLARSPEKPTNAAPSSAPIVCARPAPPRPLQRLSQSADHEINAHNRK